MLSKIVSKVLVDKEVLGGRGEKVLFLIFMVLGLISGNMGKGVEAVDRSRGDGNTGDDICRTVRNVEEREVLDIIKGGPDRSRGWGILKLGRLRIDGLEDAGGDVEGAWVIPSVVRTLKDLEDGGGGVRNVLLVDVVKG